jgi:hypothetical protein
MSQYRGVKLPAVLVCGVIAGVMLVQPLATAAQDNVGSLATDEPSRISGDDRFAVVDEDGTLDRDSGAVQVTHTPNSGNYFVKFDKNVKGCNYTATIGLSGSDGQELPGFITVAGGTGSAREVFVTTDDINGNSADRGFHLYVACK